MRMSMAASLEVRVHFADHRLVESAWNIPWEMKMTGNKEKWILRKALEGLFLMMFFIARKALILKRIAKLIQSCNCMASTFYKINTSLHEF